MTTGGGQEEVTFLQTDPRTQKIIGEAALTGVQSDAPSDSDAAEGSSTNNDLLSDVTAIYRHTCKLETQFA